VLAVSVSGEVPIPHRQLSSYSNLTHGRYEVCLSRLFYEGTNSIHEGYVTMT
jgi:hypothetical protein